MGSRTKMMFNLINIPIPVVTANNFGNLVEIVENRDSNSKNVFEEKMETMGEMAPRPDVKTYLGDISEQTASKIIEMPQISDTDGDIIVETVPFKIIQAGAHSEQAHSNEDVDFLRYEDNSDDSLDDPDFIPEDTQNGDYDVGGQENEEDGHSEKRTRRKRKLPDKWKKNIRKTKRSLGEEYTDTRGRVQPKKVPKITCHCNLKCNQIFSDAERSIICSNFWKLGSLERQHEFIIRTISKTAAALSRKERSRRNFFLKYTLPYEGVVKSVCKIMYLNTLNISDKKLRVALAKGNRSAIRTPSPDRRGKHIPANKLPEHAIMDMNNHIDSFPRMPSHWCRKDTRKEYLEADLNKEIMYKLYLEHCEEKQVKPISKTIYKEAIIKKNIGFFRPRKDQCWCYSYKKDHPDEGDKTGKTLEVYELNIQRKNAADEQKKADKKAAQEDKSIVCANFDLEAVLNCPIFFAKPVFYKRKLAMFNFTVYEVASKQGHAFLWDEMNGQRGSNEIATCVSKFISSVPKAAKQLRLYSDSCPGQNKNAIIACMLQNSLSRHESLEIIQMNFLEPGHTHMECDSMHSAIEKASEYAKIYVPNDWENVVRMAKKKGLPYKVNRLTYEDFLDYKTLKSEIMPNVHKTTTSSHINWKDVKCLVFRKDFPNSMFAKCKYWDEFQEIQTNLRRGRPNSITNNFQPQNLYKSKISINKKKYDDLMARCKDKTISREYHAFYKNLLVSQNTNDEESSDDDAMSLQAMREKILSKRRK